MPGSLAVAALLIVTWTALGNGLLRRLVRVDIPPLERLLFGFALGYGITGNLFMLYGFAGIYGYLSLLGTVVVLLFVGFFADMQLPETVQYATQAIIRTIRRHPYWTLAVLPFLVIYALRSVLPPTGIDELMYHLAVPKLYLQHGGFRPVIFNPQSNLVMLSEMNYLPVLLTGNGNGCCLIGFSVGCALLGLIAMLGKQLGNLQNPFPGILIFLSLTNTMANMSGCNVDFAMAMFVLQGFFFWIKYREQTSSLTMVLLMGFAVQSKVMGFFGVFALAGSAMLSSRRTAKAMAVILLLSLLFGLPWILKNWLYAHAATESLAGAANLERVVSSHGPSLVGHWISMLGQFLLRMLRAPWSYSLFPSQHRMDTFGPLFLTLLPGLLFVENKKSLVLPLVFVTIYISLISAMEVVYRGNAGVSIRYSIPVLVLICSLADYAWHKGFASFPAARKLVALLVLFVASVNLVILAKRYRADIRSVLSLKGNHAYLMENLPEYPAIHFANKQAGPTDTLMADVCFGTYYIDIPYLCAYRKFDDLDEMVKMYRNQGIRLLLANNILDTSRNQEVWNGDYSEEIFGKNGVKVYRLRDREEMFPVDANVPGTAGPGREDGVGP